jgi:RepB DNA-primase from phage plasmid
MSMLAAEQVTPIYDLDMAHDFFRMIERDGSFMLQTFDDVPKGVKGDGALATTVLWPAGDPAGQQRAWNKVLPLYFKGAGVFFTVNRTDGAGRRRENITDIRGVWRENDSGCATALPLDPSLTVESSPGKFHEYILAVDHWPADEQGSADHRAAEERMIEGYGSDPNAKDLSRVLRVPGFLHRKDKNNPHLVRVVAFPGWRYPRRQIVEALPPVTKAKVLPLAPHTARALHDDEGQRIRDALFSIDASERHVWLTIGMAIEAHYGQAGRALWMSGRQPPRTSTIQTIRRGFGGRSKAAVLPLARCFIMPGMAAGRMALRSSMRNGAGSMQLQGLRPISRQAMKSQGC